MDKVASLSANERNQLFQGSANKRRLQPAIIEKDFWVCWILKKLFSTPELQTQMIFKGGTSLSKVHRLIDRFSEDIDLVLAWSLIGYGEQGIDPWQDIPSSNKQDQFNKQFNERGATYIKERLCPMVQQAVKQVQGVVCLVSESDPNSIEVSYPSAFSSTAFRPEIKLEIGPLASWVPHSNHVIVPYAAEDYPRVFDSPNCTVVAISAERTFWEKATILHQQAHRPDDRVMPARYSRHYYDLYQMVDSSAASNALADLNMLSDVVLFKDRFYRSKWASYETAIPGSFRLLPTDAGEAVLRKDYSAMRPMFFNEPPAWDDVLEGLKSLETRINNLPQETS